MTSGKEFRSEEIDDRQSNGNLRGSDAASRLRVIQQYAVVARSYVLFAPLLFGIVALYDKRDVYVFRFAVLLARMRALVRR